MRTSRIAGVLAGLLLITTATTTVTANAAADPDDPALHWAGSQVAKHESGGRAGFAPLAGLPGLDVSHYQGDVAARSHSQQEPGFSANSAVTVRPLPIFT